MIIHVFRVSLKVYGDGLVFVTDEEEYKQLMKDPWFEYLGTLNEFLDKLGKELANNGVVEYYYIE